MTRVSRWIILPIACSCGLIAWAQDAAAPTPAAPAPAAPAPETPAPAPALPPITQVQIQVWISETTEKGLRDIGANLDYTRFVRGQEQSGSVERVRTQVFDTQNSEFAVTLPAPDTNGYPDNLRPDLDNNRANGIQAYSGAGMTFSVIDAGRGTIEGVFRMADQKEDVDLISKPELLVLDGKPAEIHAGGEVPYQDIQYVSGSARLNVQWQKIGVDMKLTPTILPDNTVQVNFEQLEVSDIAGIVNSRGIDLPVFATRSQKGMVLVPDGQTLVIGGLSSRLIRRTEQRVPVVGNMPLIGIPFRGRKAESVINHLLIFVSPTIVDLRNMKTDTMSAINFWREGRWQNTTRIENEIKAMANEL